MRKVLIVLLAIVIFIPLSAVSVSAASYDLGEPQSLSYITGITQNPDNWKFASVYTFDPDDNSLSIPPSVSYSYFLGYYLNKFNATNNYSPYFSFGTYVDSTYRTMIPDSYDSNSPSLLFGVPRNVSYTLFFPAIVYENIYLPMNGQYFKVSISYSSFLDFIPTSVYNFIDISTLCFLCDTSGRDGYAGRYSLPKVLPSTATVTKNANVYTYEFFFNLRSDFMTALQDSDNICLAFRIPVFFNNRSGYDAGARVYMNADIPTTYEILTVGGYDQALASIENAISSSNEQLIDLYTNQTNEDKTHVLQLQQSNDELQGSVDEYKQAASLVGSIKDEFTLPPLKNSVNQNLEEFDTTEVKNLFSIPWIASALGLVFAFSIIRLILYGTKEG